MKINPSWALLLASPSLVHAGEILEPVVISATRTPTLIDEVSRSLTVIDAATIEGRQYRSLSQALDAIPGLRTAPTGGAGQQTSVFLRGTESNHVLVLLNGMEIADSSTPSGGFEFAHLDMNNVERIEVVRGPNSVLYGSDAVGGTINIITKSGPGRDGQAQQYLQLEAGAFDTLNISTGSSGRVPGLSGAAYALGLSHQQTDGFSVTPKRYRLDDQLNYRPAEADSHESLSLNAALDLDLHSSTSLAINLRYTDTRTEVDLGASEDPDSFLNSEQWFAQARLYRVWSNDLTSEFSLEFTDHHRATYNQADAFSATVQDIVYDARKVKLDLKSDYLGIDNHILTTGLSSEREHATSSGASDFSGFILSEEMDATARTHAVYIQDQFDLDNGLFGSLGARIDRHDDFGNFFTYQFSPAYRFDTSGTTLRASLGRAFKAPALYELDGRQPNNFGGVYAGNPDLKPERSTGWDLGFEQDFAQGRAGITYYRQKLHNLIETRFSFPNSTSVNVSRARTSGVEAFLEQRLTTNTQARIDYTYTDAKSGDGQRLLRRPRHQLAADLTLAASPALSFNLRGQYVAGSKDIARQTGARLDTAEYAVFFVSASYRLNKHTQVFGRIDNVFDKDYEAVDGFQAAQRSAFIGIRFNNSN